MITYYEDNQLSENFNSKEFDSPDIPFSGNNVKRGLVVKLQMLRHLYKSSIHINSGVRSVEHNNKVGGIANSEHLTGEAVDIKCDNSIMRHELLSLALIVGFTRVGIGKSYLHLGVSATRIKNVYWLY